MLTLFTNRFQAFQPSQGVPVRITLDGVRFKLPYSLIHSVRELAPRRDEEGGLMAADAAGDMPFDEVQRRAVEEIVEAVRSRKHRRADVLLEQFVVSANLTALGALRTALRELDPNREP
ncbi:hypothetical protein [Streptomyces fulvoviolaceus]|uniref:hypothetical protein n=1 Tax=Streptomyces fulvoviolaceus TaxID=285535 RepID=UPI000ADF348D|nr:hypothetical protein [Streptomyces fulvoviolaceus]